jgi:hypothetical protein
MGASSRKLVMAPPMKNLSCGGKQGREELKLFVLRRHDAKGDAGVTSLMCTVVVVQCTAYTASRSTIWPPCNIWCTLNLHRSSRFSKSGDHCRLSPSFARTHCRFSATVQVLSTINDRYQNEKLSCRYLLDAQGNYWFTGSASPHGRAIESWIDTPS